MSRVQKGEAMLAGNTRKHSSDSGIATRPSAFRDEPSARTQRTRQSRRNTRQIGDPMKHGIGKDAIKRTVKGRKSHRVRLHEPERREFLPRQRQHFRVGIHAYHFGAGLRDLCR